MTMWFWLVVAVVGVLSDHDLVVVVAAEAAAEAMDEVAGEKRHALQ